MLLSSYSLISTGTRVDQNCLIRASSLSNIHEIVNNKKYCVECVYPAFELENRNYNRNYNVIIINSVLF